MRSFPGSRPPSVARDALAATIGHDPAEKLEELRAAGARKARAAGTAFLMEEQRKVVLSRICGEIAQVHGELSEVKLERLARAHPDYEKHLRGTSAAIEDKELAETDYWRIQAELHWMDKTVAHHNALTRLER